MKSYAILNQKGGTGKTSLGGNLGHALARRGDRVIMLDCDPQASLSIWFLTEASRWELADVLRGRVNLREAVVPVRESLDLVPTFSLTGALKDFETRLNDEPFAIGDLVHQLGESYDVALLDLSPGWGRLEKCCVLGVHEVLSPMLAEYFALDGLQLLASNLEKLRKGFRREVTHRRIVINALDQRMRRHKLIPERIANQYDYEVFAIPTDASLPKAQEEHQTVFEYNGHSRAGHAIDVLADALRNGG